MKCEKCNKNDATVKYTEIINGNKREMHLCEKCSHELGIDNINYSMPIDFSSFFGGLLEDSYKQEDFIPLFQEIKQLKCNNCNTTYDEFINNGKFGCEECYNVFSNKIDLLLKRLHGSSKYIGRKALNTGNNNKIVGTHDCTGVKADVHTDQQNSNKLQKLQDDLKKAIKDERYEDAAKIRDQIKNINSQKNN